MIRLSFVAGGSTGRWLSSLILVAGLWNVLPNRSSAQQQVRVPNVGDLLGDSVTLTGSIEDHRKKYPEIDRAIKMFFFDRDPNTAKALLISAKSSNADLPPAEILLAKMWATVQQGGMVRAVLEQGVADSLRNNKPVDPEFYLIFGDIAFSERRVSDAQLLFEKASALIKNLGEGSSPRPRRLQIRGLAGEAAVWEAREEWKLADEKLRAWLLVDNKKAAPHQRLGRVLFKMGKPTDAVAEFKEALKVEENLLPAEIMMARLYEEAGKSDDAAKEIAAAQTALKSMNASDAKQLPLYVNTCLAIAQWAITTDKTDLPLAKKMCAEAVSKDDSSLDAKIVSGIVARLQNDWTMAEGHFERAHANSPSNFVAVNNLALTLAEIGSNMNDKTPKSGDEKLRRAQEMAAINYRQYANNAEAVATMGWVLYKSGQKDQASQLIAQVANSGQITADAAYYVAQLLFDAASDPKNTKDATALLNQANTVLSLSLDKERKEPFAMRKASIDLKSAVEKKIGKKPN